MSRHMDPPTTTHMAKIMVQFGRPSCSSWAKSSRSSFGRTVMGKAIWENPIGVRLGEGFQLEMLIRALWTRLFLSVYVDDIKLAGKKQNIDPMWKVLNTQVDLGEPTSFLDHVCLGCIQRQCETCKDIIDSYRTSFECRLFAGTTDKLPSSETLSISSRSYDREGHAKKCVERYCELANKNYSTTLLMYQRHAWMTINSKKKNWHLLVKCQKYALKLSWNAYTWRVLDDPIFCGQWTNLHGRLWNGPKPVTNAWIDWFHTFITHVDTNSIGMWVILPNSADWDCLNTPILQEI